MAATASSVLTGAIINIVSCILAFLVFSWLRTWAKAYKYYDPKRYTPAIKLKPAPLPPTFLGWIVPVFRYTEPDVIQECGLDTAIYLRLLRYGLELFTWVSLWCLIAILPTNATGHECDRLMNEPDSDYKFTGFDKMSLSNIEGGSQKMWVHLVSVYVISFLAMKFLWQFSHDSVILRIQFLGNSKPSGPTHSVLVTDVPAVMGVTRAAVNERRKSETLERKQARRAAKRGAQNSGNSHLALLQAEESKHSSASYHRPSTTGSFRNPKPVTEMSEPDVQANLSENTTGTSEHTSKPAPPPGLRQRKTFTYDVTDTSMDPNVMAAARLAEGATPKDLVQEEFELVYGDQLEVVQVVRDQSGLTDLVAEYDKRKCDLEDYLDGIRDRQSRDEPLPPAKVTLLFPDEWMKEKYGGGMLKKVDALPFWRERLLWLEEQILEQQENAKTLIWPSAFVTFKSRLAQSISSTGLQHHDERTWRSRGAPEPRELLWYNLGLTYAQRTAKSAIWWVVFWLMAMFYLIPVGAIQGLIDVPKLVTYPGLKEFVSNVVVQKLLEAIVPGLVLQIFLAIVPMILAAMMRASGAVCESEVDFGVVSRFFIFQLIVVFAGNIIGASFFSQAKKWLSDPASAITLLGTAVPQSVTFFVTYIWVLIGTYPISFIRIVGLVLYRLFTWLASSPRARDRVFQEQYITYGPHVTGHSIIILLGTVFCLINPIITPSALVYFAIATVIEKYNSIYVYRRRYESSGLLWVTLLNQFMTALYIFQVVMIALLAIKKFPFAPLIIPVLLPTIGFHMMVLNLFARPWAIMSLHDAAELDANDKIGDPETLVAPYVNDPSLYIAPAFKVHKGDLTDLLSEAQAVEPLVQADVQRREAEKAEREAREGKRRCCC